MADSNSLKVMCIFEAGARLCYSSELTCLAAHIYHRFFRVKQQLSLYDLNMFASASLQLAHRFFEAPFNEHDLCLVMSDILHGQELFIDAKAASKLKHSIGLTAKVICTVLDFQINFKDTRWTTPGLLLEQQAQMATTRRIPALEIEISDAESSSSDEDDDFGETKTDRLLTKNDRHQISSHRYLVHYLKILKSLVGHDSMGDFTKLANVAWTFLCDYHWTSCVTKIYSNHLACACLVMAIEVFRVNLEKSRIQERIELWNVLNRKWNLILCDDLSDNHLKRAICLIIEQYDEYDRVLQHELSTFVIDPLRR